MAAKKTTSTRKPDSSRKNSTSKIPAPWNLNGHGYIFLYKFTNQFVEKLGNVPEFLNGTFAGGFGAVMLVDYESSNAGPYGELLFIPGKFKFGTKKINSITKIYVSSMASVKNGRENWAIPKEQADFEFIQVNKKTEKVVITKGKQSVAEFTLKSGLLRFPVSTKLMPFPLIQKQDKKYFFTNFFGKGFGSFAKIESIKINGNQFPDISLCKPIAVIKVNPFDITFPEAVVR